jgi:cytochrome P450
MEQYLDYNLAILQQKIDQYARTDTSFDLKKLLHYYTIDVLGELAFSQPFGIQETDDEALIPPVVEHSLLAACTGAWPAMMFQLKRWLPKISYRPLQELFKGRQRCADLASTCVRRRLASVDAGTNGDEPQRTDILTSLINATHPDTGQKLTQLDLETEAFGFM